MALLALLVPALAHADGDPASDILLGANVFYPYQPPVSQVLEKRLNAETAAAHRAGFPVKVALIHSRIDLGVITSLFGKPQAYADFLDREISFQGPQPLLVVMSGGYGVRSTKPAVALAVAKLPRPAGPTSDDLAQAAITAVAKMSAADGHAATGGPVSTKAGSGSSSTAILVGLVVAAVVVAGALIAVRRRQGSARPARG